MERRHRIGLTAGLVAVVAFIGFMGLGASPESTTPASPRVPTPTTLAATVAATTTADYVVVDSVDGNILTVHTTRGPEGHDLAPYLVYVDENTVFMPLDSADLLADRPVTRPGSRLYVVGTVIDAVSPPERVRATRIFPL